MITVENFELPSDALAAFCNKWKVRELSLFGSVLRPDFRPDSDIDILLAFEENVPWTLWDWIDMTDELKSIFGRDVDVVEESGLRNPFRRREILRTKEVVYGG